MEVGLFFLDLYSDILINIVLLFHFKTLGARLGD